MERKRTFQQFGEGAPERRERGSRGGNRASILLWRCGGFFFLALCLVRFSIYLLFFSPLILF